MKDVSQAQKNVRSESHGSYMSYIIGFLLSLEFTIAAYLLATNRNLEKQLVIPAIVGLAIAQLLVQLVFFLHLGKESRPRWNLTVLLFAALVVLILVFGSLWIMNNLNYPTMSPAETDKYLIKEEAISR